MWPEMIAGLKDLAGFMEAPVSGPAIQASRKITDPIKVAFISATRFVRSEQYRITVINKKVRKSSRRKQATGEQEGSVVPRLVFNGNTRCKRRLASRAPMH